VNNATRLPPSAPVTPKAKFQGGTNRGCRLAVVACKHVGVNRKGDTCLSIIQPLRDSRDIHTLGDALAGVRMPESGREDFAA